MGNRGQKFGESWYVVVVIPVNQLSGLADFAEEDYDQIDQAIWSEE